MTHDPYAALRVHDFRWLLFGHAALTLGREAQIVVIGWQMFEATGDPLTLGLIGLAEAFRCLHLRSMPATSRIGFPGGRSRSRGRWGCSFPP